MLRYDDMPKPVVPLLDRTCAHPAMVLPAALDGVPRGDRCAPWRQQLIVTNGPGGEVHPNPGVYLEVVPDKRQMGFQQGRGICTDQLAALAPTV